MNSTNHQFIGFDSKIVKKYVRTTIYPVSGRRLNPLNRDNPDEVIDFLLATPADNFKYDVETDPNGGATIKTTVSQAKFEYEQEVVELYSDDEVRLFQRMNRELLVNGDLVEYDEKAPEVDLVNTLSDTDIKKLVRLKTKTIFESKVKEITSLRTLKLVMAALEETDAPMSYAKIIKERENELNQK